MSFFSLDKLISKVSDSIIAALRPAFISGQKQRWKDDFNGTSLSSDWVISKNTGNGSIAVTGSEVTLRSGTAIGVTAIRTVAPFKIPCKATFIFKQIGKQVNQKFKMSVVNATGDNYARVELLANSVIANIESSNSPGFVTTGTVELAVNWATQQIAEIDLTLDDVRWSAKSINISSAKQQTTKRNTRIPLPSENYFIEIETENTLIATNAQFIIDSVSFLENEIFQSEMVSVRHNKNPDDGLCIGTFLPTASVNVANPSIVILNNTTFYTETLANLAASSMFTGTTKGMNGRGVCIVSVIATASGNLFIDESPDGITWHTFPAYPCVVGGNLFRREPSLNNIRIRYINGSTATASLAIYSLIKAF
jgi:hypothetical protein